MKKCKLALPIFIVIFAMIISGDGAFALSIKQQGHIAKRCDTIKDTLKSLQHSDSYSRVHLESVYSEIFSNYMVPLNTRMQNNGIINKDLSDNQEDFVETRAKFKADFITYSKQLENLINIDCENKPEEFYEQLEYVRLSRNETNLDVEKMSKIISKHQEIVREIRTNL